MTSDTRRPGDRLVRVERKEPETYRAPDRKHRRPPPSPAVSLVAFFVVLVTGGTLVLMLPAASHSGQTTRLIDALFTATSAACVTGLVVVDTATHWSPFGQVVILVLIQLGGFGIMAGSTLMLLVFFRRSTLRGRLLVQESLGGPELGTVTWLVRRIAIFTVACELAGAIVLSIAFMAGPEAGPPGSPLGIWWGIFHSVSAFNNAGFDLTGDFVSLIPFRDDWVVLSTVAILLVLGGLGFAIVGDAAGRHRWTRMALETKLVLAATASLLVGGAVLIGIGEWSNPATLGGLSVDLRLLNAFFESATLRTAGFTALDTGAFVQSTLFVAMGLMFIGGASGGTAGGIKVNTLSVLIIAIVSTFRGEPSATAFGRRIQHAAVYRALSVALLSIAFVFMISLGLAATTEARFIDTLFEAVSASATVGLSTGITPELTDPARLITAFAMFVGRLGPLTLVLALAGRANALPYRPAVESVRIG